MTGRSWIFAFALLLLACTITSAYAQGRGGRGGGRQKNQDPAPKEQSADPSIAPPPAAAAIPWPRLEKGSIICTTREDLVSYQTLLELSSDARSQQQQPKCDYVEKQTGIQIVGHDGPSRTQISTTAEPKQVGWTNTFLPEVAPSK